MKTKQTSGSSEKRVPYTTFWIANITTCIGGKSEKFEIHIENFTKNESFTNKAKIQKEYSIRSILTHFLNIFYYFKVSLHKNMWNLNFHLTQITVYGMCRVSKGMVIRGLVAWRTEGL